MRSEATERAGVNGGGQGHRCHHLVDLKGGWSNTGGAGGTRGRRGCAILTGVWRRKTGGNVVLMERGMVTRAPRCRDAAITGDVYGPCCDVWRRESNEPHAAIHEERETQRWWG